MKADRSPRSGTESWVSVIVLNYNGAHLLPDCLNSLLAQDYPNLEILVVDNASLDESKEVVSHYPSVRWIGLSTNGGLGPGYNAGAREATGEKIFFVNNDMRFERDCVGRLVEAFRTDNILAADPMQMDWNGKEIIHGAQRFRFAWHYFRFGVPFIDPYQDLQADGEIEIPWGCAGAMMFERRKFESLGGFDPTFFLDYEDLDICWRGWLRGWKSVFVPAARLYHKVGESEDGKLRVNSLAVRKASAPLTNDRRRLSQCKNAQRFIMKVMPAQLILACFCVEAVKIALSLLRGHLSSAYLRSKAMMFNFREWGDIIKERRALRQQSVTSTLSLLTRWGSYVP